MGNLSASILGESSNVIYKFFLREVIKHVNADAKITKLVHVAG